MSGRLNRFLHGKLKLANLYLTYEWLAYMCWSLSTNRKRTLFTWFICVAFPKMADTSQDEREATLEYIEGVHNCLAVLDVSSVSYKDTQHKEKKLEEPVDKESINWVSSKPFHFYSAFCFLSSSVSLLYESATALSRSANYRVLWFGASLMRESTSFPTFWNLPTRPASSALGTLVKRKVHSSRKILIPNVYFTLTIHSKSHLKLTRFCTCYEY